MRIYRFIDCQRADFSVTILCRVCEVSCSAYYAWARLQTTGPDEATVDEAILTNEIHDIWTRSRRRYGVPRVTAELWRRGRVVNHTRVARIMAELGISGICGRRKLRTTQRDPQAAPAPDQVERDFSAAEFDRLWIGDVTYLSTDEG